jgi:hypothetical protein
MAGQAEAGMGTAFSASIKELYDDIRAPLTDYKIPPFTPPALADVVKAKNGND